MFKGPLDEMQIIGDFEVLAKVPALLTSLDSSSYQFPKALGVCIFLRLIKFGISIQFQNQDPRLPLPNLKIESPPPQEVQQTLARVERPRKDASQFICQLYEPGPQH